MAFWAFTASVLAGILTERRSSAVTEAPSLKYPGVPKGMKLTMVNRTLATGVITLAGFGLLSLSRAPGRGAVYQPHPFHQAQGPSAMEFSLYGLNSWDRSILSARSKGMGGVSLALPGAAHSGSLNPAALASLGSTELSAEARSRGGSASSSNFPTQIIGGDGSVIDVSHYRPSINGTYTYNNLAFGMPIVLLNRRGGVAVGYHRLIDFRTGEESRMKVRSPLGEADLGQGIEFHGGVDALTPSFGLNVNNNLSLGGALNFMNGTITENGNQGITVFGFVFARGALLFEQDVSATSIDLGAQYKLGPRLKIGATLPGLHAQFPAWLLQLPAAAGAQNTTDPSSTAHLLDHTLSVPTMWGVGGSYEMMDGRLLLATDFWNRPWSKATYQRKDFDILTLFPDSTALQSNLGVYLVDTLGVHTTKSANLIDTSHMRFGAEYLVKQGGPGRLKVPLRLGFRREPLTLANSDPDSFNAIVRAQSTINGDPNLSTIEKQALISDLVSELLKNGASLVLTDRAVTGTTISLGSGHEIGAFSLDVPYRRTSYTIDRLTFGSFYDMALNPRPQRVTEKHADTEFTLSTTLRF